MKNLLFLLILIGLLSCASTPKVPAQKQTIEPTSTLIKKQGSLSVDATVEKLVQIIASKNDVGMKVFMVVDHKAGALSVNLELEDAKVVVFGNPNVGTKLMQANPKLALDLPMKILVYKKGDHTHILYRDPFSWKSQLPESKHPILKKISGVLDELTDAIKK